MNSKNSWQPNSASGYLARLEEYKRVVTRLFPTIPKRVVNNWSIFPTDVLATGFFLEHYPSKAVVLDVGTFIGVSTFCLATHPKVSEVVSVDPNPTIFDELADKSEDWRKNPEIESLKDVKVLDIARAAFDEFPEAKKKVQFCEGVVGSAQIGIGGEILDDPEKVTVPTPDPSETGMIALVDGLHTREGVQADLEAIFDQNPYAVAFVDDCRHRWGPFVQAGVVDFMEQAEDEYNFQLVGDLGPGLARSNLGIVYPDSQVGTVGKTLADLSWTFSQRLDPLRLLKREEELAATVSRISQELEHTRKSNNHLEVRISRVEERDAKRKEYVSRLKEHSSGLEERDAKRKEHVSRLKKQISNLEERNTQLTKHYQSKRYKLADAAAESALHIPGLKGLLHRNTP